MKTIALLGEIPEIHTCNSIFLVGGFGDSEVLRYCSRLSFCLISKNRLWGRTELKKGFGDRVVKPAQPGLAVLRGAVMFGLNQKAITSRIMKCSYGISTTKSWRDFDASVSKFVLFDG